MRLLERLAAAAALAALACLGGAAQALADNCGSPGDCQGVPGNIAAATGFAAGAAAVALVVALTQGREKTAQSWIGIRLVDEDGVPVSGEPYQVQLPDGSIEEGTLDSDGAARIDDVDEGTYLVCFPNIDASEWRQA